MKTENVCVVDDDLVYQFTAKKMLSRIETVGKVFIFSDGEQAFQYLESNSGQQQELPSVIFLDINMPYMDGWTFVESYKEIKPNLARSITIYMVSSSSEKEDMSRAREYSEISGYIVKPITQDMFRQKISEILEN